MAALEVFVDVRHMNPLPLTVRSPRFRRVHRSRPRRSRECADGPYTFKSTGTDLSLK